MKIVAGDLLRVVLFIGKYKNREEVEGKKKLHVFPFFLLIFEKTVILLHYRTPPMILVSEDYKRGVFIHEMRVNAQTD